MSPLEAPPVGLGDQESQYAYWMMIAHPEWVVLNRGVNGQRTDEILERFQRDVILERPNYAIILAGVNDIYQGASSEVTKTNLLAMYQEAISAGIIPVAATVLPYSPASEPERDALHELNNWITVTASGLGIPVCDTNHAVADPLDPDRLRSSPEGLHPDASGYRAMGEALTHTIEVHLEHRIDFQLHNDSPPTQMKTK
jgi:acyl-CoA thioesterase-1